MEPGLRLLIQLVLEFAPVIVDLIQKRKEESLTTTNYLLPTVVNEAVRFGKNLMAENDSYDSSFEQTKLLQQQLAVYQRETQLKVATQERETALKLPEVYKIFDSWLFKIIPITNFRISDKSRTHSAKSFSCSSPNQV